MTETLRQEVVPMKDKGMTLSAIAREVGHSKSVISRILQVYNDSDTNSFKSPKRLVIHVRQMHDRIMQRLLTGLGSTLQMELLTSSAMNKIWICFVMFKRSR